MIKNIVKSIFASRHTWRHDAREFSGKIKKLDPKRVKLGGFDELSELYVSVMFRSLALSVIGVFVPVFLLKNGYEITAIFMFFCLFFACRTIMDIVGGYLVAKIGPKHTMVISYLSQIVASLLFLTLPDMQWPLILPAFFWATANSLFFIAFHVDFSKVKHSEHGGKELGYVNIMHRIGAAIGPISGGLMAFFLSPKYIFVGAIVLLLVGLIPLFKTAEPTRINQHLDFKNFKIDHLKRDYFSYMAFTAEANLTLILWPIFLALFALGTNLFLELGALTSIGIAVSIFASYQVGKLVDENKGKKLLNAAASLNSLLHLLRPFINSFPLALGLGVVNDVVTVGYQIPYHKAMYDAADDQPGYRIVYLCSIEAIASFSKMIIWIILLMLACVVSVKTVITLGFCIAAAASLLITTQKFKSLEYAKSNG